MHGSLGDHVALLLQGHEAGLVHLAAVGEVSVDQVRKEALHSQVALVAHHVAAEARQSEVGPVGTLDTVHILVVLNSIKSVLESIGVEQGVQGVSAG